MEHLSASTLWSSWEINYLQCSSSVDWWFWRFLLWIEPCRPLKEAKTTSTESNDPLVLLTRSVDIKIRAMSALVSIHRVDYPDRRAWIYSNGWERPASDWYKVGKSSEDTSPRQHVNHWTVNDLHRHSPVDVYSWNTDRRHGNVRVRRSFVQSECSPPVWQPTGIDAKKVLASDWSSQLPQQLVEEFPRKDWRENSWYHVRELPRNNWLNQAEIESKPRNLPRVSSKREEAADETNAGSCGIYFDSKESHSCVQIDDIRIDRGTGRFFS